MKNAFEYWNCIKLISNLVRKKKKEIRELEPASSGQAGGLPPSALPPPQGRRELVGGHRVAVGWAILSWSCPARRKPTHSGAGETACDPRGAQRWSPPGSRCAGRGPCTWPSCSAWPWGCCRPSGSTCGGCGCCETCALSPRPPPTGSTGTRR